MFITERIEYSLACLADANSPSPNPMYNKDHLRSKIPTKLETKVIALELMEALNFLH